MKSRLWRLMLAILMLLWMGATAQPATAADEIINGTATHYGYSYHGQRMGCGGIYSSYDETIVAVSPSRYAEWPCGTELQVIGPAGTIIVTRQDSCPGCSRNMIDISEAGSIAVCGGRPHTCRVEISVVK